MGRDTSAVTAVRLPSTVQSEGQRLAGTRGVRLSALLRMLLVREIRADRSLRRVNI